MSLLIHYFTPEQREREARRRAAQQVSGQANSLYRAGRPMDRDQVMAELSDQEKRHLRDLERDRW